MVVLNSSFQLALAPPMESQAAVAMPMTTIAEEAADAEARHEGMRFPLKGATEGLCPHASAHIHID